MSPLSAFALALYLGSLSNKKNERNQARGAGASADECHIGSLELGLSSLGSIFIFPFLLYCNKKNFLLLLIKENFLLLKWAYYGCRNLLFVFVNLFLSF